jgi:hypothetical protein
LDLKVQVAFNVMFQKSYLLLQDVDKFVFDKELFHEMESVLERLNVIVPQKPLSSEASRALVAEERVQKEAAKLLEIMSVVVYSLGKTGSAPNLPICNYVEQTLSRRSQGHMYEVLFQTRVGAQPVSYAKAVYEFLEDIMAVAEVESLPLDYKEELGVVMKKRVEMRMGPSNDKSGLKVPTGPFFTALRRFAFRYLRVSSIDPTHFLAPYLNDERRWPDGTFEVSVFIVGRVNGVDVM